MNVVLEVKGMSCNHCEKAVKDALTALEGVEGVEAHAQQNEAKVDYDNSVISLEAICEAIEEQGYDVVR